MIADIAHLRKGFDALGVPYAYASDELPPVLTLKGAGGDLVIEFDTAAEQFSCWFGPSHFEVPYGEEDALIETVAAFVRGEIEAYGVYVGRDCRVAGFCERSYLARMARDFSQNIDLVGAEIRLRGFGSEREECLLLTEIDA